MKRQKQVERRRYTRIALDTQVEIVQGSDRYAGELVDISFNGVLVATGVQEHIKPDRPCTIEVHLSSNTHITMHCMLAHSSPALLGFHCISMDIESAAHLRRLVEVNLPDCSASDRALRELLQRLA